MTKPDQRSEPPETWDDGTLKSTDNVFTDHGYIPGVPVQPSAPAPKRAHGNFGFPNGTIPGLADKKARKA